MANKIKVICLVFIGKIFSRLSRLFNLGNGSTWPGQIALLIFPEILTYYESHIKKGIILVAGTNGKTTTSQMLSTVLNNSHFCVIHNSSGANLLNGIISCLLINSDFHGRLLADYAIFEVDEATLPQILHYLTHKNLSIILLNLFRDQLDRYGEVDNIARKWTEAIRNIPKEAKLIINADDPQTAHIGIHAARLVYYFGLEDKNLYLKSKEHAADSIYCPNCGEKLIYHGVYYSHLGVWECAGCKETRPKTHLNNWPQPITGLYNLYNTLASVLTLQILKLSDFEINTGFKKFHPAFGRQEVFEIDGKRIIILLTKNPVGMNVAIRSIIQELKLTSGNKGGYFLLALNDLTPDGRDVSWIWDVDLEELVKNSIMLICSGIRSYDLGVCIKYAGCKNFIVETNLLNAIKKGLHSISPGESLYILPTYSAMLEVRKILTGKKI